MPFTLYMLMVGCRPPGRFTEQHDVFFGIAETPAGLIPKLHLFWPEARRRMHVDAVRPVTCVAGYRIGVAPRTEPVSAASYKLFFLNLGGYKKDEFDEAHYKMLAVATSKSDAIKQARQTAFYKHTSFADAPAHLDDKWGVDVDDVYEISDMLPAADKAQFALTIAPDATAKADGLYLGYITFDKLAKLAT
ncbi:MAG TPA: DUF1543 domain-containing protein [Chitinophagaceae bacterium]|nr:DUF1543 domain-containing protein [Chitinophagaceae bacterium]